MEHHLPCDPSDISRYVLCPGDLRRARKLAAHFEDCKLVLGAYRRWRTAALFTSDGSATEIKPEWGEAEYQHGQDQTIQIALDGMRAIARADKAE